MAFSCLSTPQRQQQSPFQAQPQSQPFQQQQQQQQPQQQFILFTNEKTPVTYGTKWADLHPDSQKVLLQIEDEIQRLDQCSRLYESSLSNDGFELDKSHAVQELGGVGTAMGQQKAVILGLMAVVKDVLRSAEVGTDSNATAAAQAPVATVAPDSSSQTGSTAIMSVFDFHSGLPRKPSSFFQQTVARFEKELSECRQWIEELEQLLLLDSQRNSSVSSSSLLQSLPKGISNVHDFFVHVAAKVELIHQYMESMKTAYLADQRRNGDGNNPFLEADRRATARQEAAAKRVHPTLHLPAAIPQSTQAAGLFASSETPGSSIALQTSTAVSSASSGGGLFSSLSAPSRTASLFSTPATSAPALSLFGPPAASPQTPLFGTSGLLFASASTPSVFTTPTRSFTPTAATGSSLFSTPFPSGTTAPGSSIALQTSTAVSSASSGGGLFSSLSAPSRTASLFSTPATSAPALSLFGPPAASPQTPLFGTSGSLFASASTPSVFTTPTRSFTPTAATGSSLFSTPFPSGTTAPGSSIALQTSTAVSSASSGGGLFSSLSAPSRTASLFSTPATSAPALSLFGPPAASPQTPLFGTSGSLFASASTPSVFTTPTRSFIPTAATGSSLFSTPFPSGTTSGSGASFGAQSEQSRPKTRTSRH